MKTQLPNLLGAIVRDYFTDHLPRLRGTSPHTIHSYRDSLVLLLRFLSVRSQRPVVELDLKDLDPPGILAFLSYLERERKNGVTTRNVRLSAIHALFRFVASRNPEHLDLAQRVLGIPFKRAPQRAIDYLEYEEIDSILKAIDRTIPRGTRDYALLATMFNTGGRVQEIADLRACDFQLSKPFQVRLFGKECHSYCIFLRPRHETTGTHACRQAYDLAFSWADILPVVRTGIGLGPYTDAHGASRVEPMSEPYPA
jgi:site-specific recombinase XerD